jgi:parvulin-like peptidyl-prolyl isomerase
MPVPPRTTAARAAVRHGTPASWLALLAALALLLATAPAHAAPSEAQSDDVLVRLGDETVTRAQFDEEFEIAARATALQQGMEPTPDVLAEFGAFRSAFLDQLATQLVLVRHAQELGVGVHEAEVDEVIDEVRAAQVDEEGFARYLETAGFSDETALRAVIERSMNVQNVIAALSEDIEVGDAEIEAWYEANQEQVQTPEGPLPLDAIRDEIASIVVQEQVDARVQELVAAAPLEVFVDRL